ncbi:MAG: hypothetical protein LBD78_06630 [Spirochaetaceae bacterium]|nr:hypothetical protein [Spirochaetaceae bacterium]
MKKPVLPRFIGFLLLYSVIFVVLVILQFTRQNGFIHRVGVMRVSGHYDVREAGMDTQESGEYFLSGGASVFFGGMEFRLTGERRDDGFKIIRQNKEREGAAPLSMVISGNTVLFRFAGGYQLEFALQNDDGRELRIFPGFGEEGSAMELPFRLGRNTRMAELGDGQVIVNDGGTQYSFSRPSIDRKQQLILIEDAGIVYRAVPESRGISPDSYVISQARDFQLYQDAVNRWRDGVYARWNRNAGSLNDEARIVAYIGEALQRNSYGIAVASLSSAVRTATRKGFDVAVYLGQLNQAFQSFSAFDRETRVEITRLIGEGSTDFLKEPHVFAWLGIRGLGNLIDEGAALIYAIDPVLLSEDIIPGILESFVDWKRYRPYGDNPFEDLIDPALSRIHEGIQRDAKGERVLFFSGSRADSEFNFRLGLALKHYGEETGNDGWAALGRSLVLSILSLDDNTGSVPAGIGLSDTGEIVEKTEIERVGAARLCRLLSPNSYPRALSIGADANGIWAYTASPAIRASQSNNILDVAVTFPVGETHYMMIRGVKPFTKLQLYNMDYRTDPQFERYDSSGWSYLSEEQTLLLKMKHRDETEHIRIFF